MGKILIQISGIKQQTVPLYAVNDVQELSYTEKFFRILALMMIILANDDNNDNQSTIVLLSK